MAAPYRLGEQIGAFQVIKRLDRTNGRGNRYYRIRCHCGRRYTRSSDSLCRHRGTRSCRQCVVFERGVVQRSKTRGSELARIRVAANIKQRKLAEMVGMPMVVISRIENEDISYFRRSRCTIFRFARLCGQLEAALNSPIGFSDKFLESFLPLHDEIPQFVLAQSYRDQSSSITPEEVLMREERLALLRSELDKLPPRDRQILTWRVVEEQTLEEISAKVKLTREGVRLIVERCLQMLGGRLRKLLRE